MYPKLGTPGLKSSHANGCGFASHLGALCFCNSDCLHILIRGTSFSFGSVYFAEKMSAATGLAETK